MFKKQENNPILIAVLTCHSQARFTIVSIVKQLAARYLDIFFVVYLIYYAALSLDIQAISPVSKLKWQLSELGNGLVSK